MSIKVLLTALLLAKSISAFAADTNGDGKDTILLPIGFRGAVSETFTGAFGTRWQGETTLHNAGPFDVILEQSGLCPFTECNPVIYRPGFIGFLQETRWRNPERGILLQPLAPAGAALTFSSRLSEISRHAQPQGFQIPVVREEQFLTKPSLYLRIPSNPAVRTSIRVYDPRRAGTGVHIDVLDDTGRVVHEMTVSLPFPDTVPADVLQPGFAILNDFASTVPGLPQSSTYQLRITPIPAGREYWAMVSVTDNDTQHVLIITSQ
jgi:hypothetical protein